MLTLLNKIWWKLALTRGARRIRAVYEQNHPNAGWIELWSGLAQFVNVSVVSKPCADISAQVTGWMWQLIHWADLKPQLPWYKSVKMWRAPQILYKVFLCLFHLCPSRAASGHTGFTHSLSRVVAYTIPVFKKRNVCKDYMHSNRCIFQYENEVLTR